MPILIEGEELAPTQFYLAQMQRAIDMYQTGHLAEIGLPVMSFFSGVEQHQPYAKISAVHIHVFLEDKEMQHAIERNPSQYIQWVAVIFHYFLEMAAFPTIASSIWRCCWTVLKMLEQNNATFWAQAQMAAWAGAYDVAQAAVARAHIKTMPLQTQMSEASRSLVLSTAVNKEQDDYKWHINNAFVRSAELSPIHKLHAYINYYCQIDPSRKILNFIISALNWVELYSYRQGKLGLLEAVVWTLQDKNNYKDLLFLLRCLKLDIRQEYFKSAHAFILPNIGATFTALKKDEKITFPLRDNGEHYVKLMRLCNKLNGVAISIRGEEELGADPMGFEEYGVPSRENRFDDLRQVVVEHYQLEDDFYRELNLLTLVPSHNHPIQGALCSLGHIPPLLSTSLEDLVDEGDVSNFIFFLASSTYTHDLEKKWIIDRFGENANIHTDPARDFLMATFNDEKYTHIYISAHGKYDHWEKNEERIHFSDISEIGVEELRATRKDWKQRRTLILNICDGAASRLSYNPNNSGLAAALASGGQVVVSHLWPVNPKYAACFGILMLHHLGGGPISPTKAAFDVYNTLSKSNHQIVEEIRDMGVNFTGLSGMINKSELEISDFRNIGSIAIYA